MKPINRNWTTEEGLHAGGISTGIGYTISWQRGALNVEGRNGAFLIEVLQSCLHQLEYYQNSKFACKENLEAIAYLSKAITELQNRANRRENEGTLGTHNL